MIDDAVGDFETGDVDGVGERENVGVTVAFDDNALQTEQGRAVVAAGINARLGTAQDGQGKECGNFAEDIAAKFLLQRGLDVFGDAFY